MFREFRVVGSFEYLELVSFKFIYVLSSVIIYLGIGSCLDESNSFSPRPFRPLTKRDSVRINTIRNSDDKIVYSNILIKFIYYHSLIKLANIE